MDTPIRCIYAIDCVDGTRYIGQTVHYYNRRKQHLSRLRNNSHEVRLLQEAWNKLGEDAFTFVILEEVSDEQPLDEREQHWLDITPAKFNVLSKAGKVVSQAALDASAEKRRGVPLTQEHRDKVGAGLKGKKRPPRSPEHIAKLKAAAKARMADPARRAALSQTLKERGIAPSDEARRLAAEKNRKSIS